MKKLIEALHVIQDECKRYNDCTNCPMGTKDFECLLRDLDPCDWKINDEVQKALL